MPRFVNRRSAALVSVVALAVGGVLVFFGPGDPGEAEANCTAGLDAFSELEVDVANDVALVPRAGKPLGFTGSFGTQRKVKDRTLSFDWAGNAKPLLETTAAATATTSDSEAIETVLQKGDVLDVSWDHPVRVQPDDDARFGSERIGITATSVEGGVAVRICVGATGADPGRYTTAIQFTDPSIKAAPIQMDLVVKESDLRIPLLAVLTGIVVAGVLIWLRWHAVYPDNESPQIASVAVGLILAVMAVVSTAVAAWRADQTWGDDSFGDPFAMFVSTTLGIVGSAALGEAAPGLNLGAFTTSQSSDTPEPTDTDDEDDET